MPFQWYHLFLRKVGILRRGCVCFLPPAEFFSWKFHHKVSLFCGSFETLLNCSVVHCGHCGTQLHDVAVSVAFKQFGAKR